MLLEEKTDPRVKRTRQLLQTALLELLAEQPFHNITVQDVTARAGVNRATFYAHFEDKYELLNQSMRENFQARLDARLPRDPQFTVDNLRVVTVTVYEFLSEFLSRCAPVHQVNEEAVMLMQVHQQLYETLLAWVKHADSAHLGSQKAEVAATIVSWSVWGTALQRFGCHGQAMAPTALADQVLELLSRGLHEYLREDAQT